MGLENFASFKAAPRQEVKAQPQKKEEPKAVKPRDQRTQRVAELTQEVAKLRAEAQKEEAEAKAAREQASRTAEAARKAALAAERAEAAAQKEEREAHEARVRVDEKIKELNTAQGQ